MEVHAHSHSARKNWKHYLWEFLMLFLAVFCGFLAEYQLEHKIEKEKEEQFIKSFVQDLKQDTTRLLKILNSRKRRGVIIDSLSLLLNNNRAGEYGNYLYFFARNATRTADIRFIPNDGTMQQLKNSGGLRLIRKPVVADGLIKYDVAVRNMLTQTQLEQTIAEEFRTACSKIFDGRVFDKMFDSDAGIQMLSGNPEISGNKEDMFQLYFRMHYLNAINILNRNVNSDLLQRASSLLMLLKKEYHLE